MIRLFSDRVIRPKPDGGLVVEPALVGIDGAFIQEVTPCDRADLPDGVTDLGNKVLAPAFVNAHTHLPMSAFRGVGGVASLEGNVVEDLFFRLEHNLEPEDIRAFARIGAWECLLNGTGTVWEHYYGGMALADGLADVGLTGVVGFALQDLAGPGVAAMEQQWDATLALSESGAHADAGLVAAIAPHATDTVSPVLWDRIAALADARQLPVHVHVAQSLEEVERSRERHGTTPLGMLQSGGWLAHGPSWALVHMIYVGQDELNALDPARHAAVYCPYSQVQFELPAPVSAWRKAGLDLVIATDAGVCNDTMNVQQDLRMAAGAGMYGATLGGAMAAMVANPTLEHARAVRAERRHRFDAGAALAQPAALLRTVWEAPGRLAPSLPVGAIRVGHRANLCVWDLDHPATWPGLDPLRALAYSDCAPALWGMVVNGAWVSTPGAHQASILASARYRDHVAEATARLSRVLDRAGVR